MTTSDDAKVIDLPTLANELAVSGVNSEEDEFFNRCAEAMRAAYRLLQSRASNRTNADLINALNGSIRVGSMIGVDVKLLPDIIAALKQSSPAPMTADE